MISGGKVTWLMKSFPADRILQAYPAWRGSSPSSSAVAGDRPQPRPAAREPQLTIGLLQHRRAAGKAQPLWRRRHPLPDAGEGGHGSPLHGGVLNDDPATMRIPFSSVVRVKRAFSPQLVDWSSTTSRERGICQ